MNIESTIKWFEEIAAGKISSHSNSSRRERGVVRQLYNIGEATKWITEAQSALESVFPSEHTVRKRWYAALDLKTDFGFSSPAVVNSARAVFDSALNQLKAGRLTSLVTSIRAETVGELLDQAELLFGKKYLVAATVLAGGALETHLLHLCNLSGITWEGDGSIGTYNNAIAREQKKGKEVYSSAYVKQIVAWADYRNKAAHAPTEFSADSKQIENMIDGIKDFIARTT